MGSLPEWLRAGIAAIAQGRNPNRARASLRVPSAGPWAVPPSSELVAWVDPESSVAEVRLALFREVRWMLRLSGWLARNPWLRGGRVRSGEVWWEDGAWCFRSDPRATTDESLEALLPSLPKTPSVDPAPRWPDEPALAAFAARRGETAAVALCRRTETGLLCGEPWRLPPGPGGLWGWPEDGGGWFLLAKAQVLQLPLGVVRRAGGDAPKLPLEDLLRAASAVSLVEREGWEAAVSGSKADDAALELLSRLEPWSLPAGFRAAWLRPEGVELIAEAQRRVEKLPFVTPGERERWGELEVFLRPFAEQGFSLGWVQDATHQPFSLVFEFGERRGEAPPPN